MQTEKDAEIVGWVGRVGAAGAEHVMGRFGMRRSWAYGPPEPAGGGWVADAEVAAVSAAGVVYCER